LRASEARRRQSEGKTISAPSVPITGAVLDDRLGA